MAALPTSLENARYALLITYRRDGTPVSTPVGPIAREGTLYVYTLVTSGKAKRVRRTSRVQVAACTSRGAPTGPAIEARARIATGAEDAEMRERFRRQWARTYGPLYGLMTLVERLRRVKRCVIAIVPA